MTRATLFFVVLAGCYQAKLEPQDGTTSAGSSSTASARTSTGASTTASPSSTGASTGPSSTGARTTTGASGTAGTTTGGGASSGAGSATSGGTGSVGFLCPAGFAFVGGNCVTASCTGFSNSTACQLPDAGLGFCSQGTCSGVQLASDPQNCGQVGLICASDTTCIDGVCTGPGGAPSSCAAGVCPVGLICLGSDCLFGSACSGAPVTAECVIDAGFGDFGLCCGGACLQEGQLSGDPQNCGTCGNACPSGSLCQQSVCVPTTCAATAALDAPCFLPDGGQENFSGVAGAACCGGACRDLTQDPENCGECGVFCPAGHVCENGICAGHCSSNADCGAGGVCTDLGCLPSTCPPGGSQSACGLAVSASTAIDGECCGGACTNPLADSQNCGACGVSCGSGACVDSACGPSFAGCAGEQPGSLCTLSTDAGTAVQGQCCSGACVLNDDANCGGCGLICPTGTTCTNVGGAPQCASGQTVVTCTSSGQCASGQVCLNGICASETCAPNQQGQVCGLPDGGGGVCCGASCSDLISDPQNCQGCGAVCPAGTACVGAQESDGPLANCVDPASDEPVYCSATSICPAGAVCPVDDDVCEQVGCAGRSEGSSCVLGLTSLGTVQGVCCGGQCVSFVDPKNCGACGAVCPNGACLTSPFGGAICAPGGSTCVQSCPLGTACLGSTCQSVTCTSPFGGFCPAPDGNVGVCTAADGGFTCLDTLDDPTNCGGAGVACPAGQTCHQGLCSGTPAPCNAPGALGTFCDVDAGFGWNCCQGVGCVNLFQDDANCGTCGNACPAGFSCQGGVCG